MTFPTLRRTLLVAFGVGVLASAGQLGLGYGLGILRFGHAFDDVDTSRWPAQLAWLAWFAMTAAVIAALAATTIAARVAGRAADPPTIGVRVAVAVAAALGGAAVAPLSMVPAQATRLPSVDPVLVTGVCAALGATVGLFAAMAVLGPAPIRWNLLAVGGAGWLLALVSVAPSLGATDPMPAVRLGVLDPAWLSGGLSQRLTLVTMPALTLVAGAATGGLARWRDHRTSVVATCGVAGAAMLSLSYLIAGPGADRYQTTPYWAALAAAATGVLGSVLAATVRWPILGDSAPAQEDTPDAGTPAATPASTTAPPDSATETTTDLGRPGVTPGPANGSEETTGSGTLSPPMAPTTRRPTTEDFWPATAAAPVPSTPVTGDAAATTIAETSALVPEPAQPGHESGATEPGATEPGTTEPGAGVSAAEVPIAATPASRSERSWRRLFRRSDPAPSQEVPSETSAAADVANVGDAGVEPDLQDRGVEPDAAAEQGGVDVAASPIEPVRAAERGGRGRNDRRPADPQPAGTEPVGGEPADPEPADPEPAGDKPADQFQADQEPADQEPAGPAPTDGKRADGKRAGGRRTRKKTADGEPGDGEPGDAIPQQRPRRGRGRSEPEVSAADAEYVDWVSGLRGRRTQRADPPRSERSTPPTSPPSPARGSAGQRQVDLPAGRDELG